MPALAVLSLSLLQAVALLVLLRRLVPGRHRAPPAPPGEPEWGRGAVSVVVPARNEGGRIGPCLDGLLAQGATMREAIVVDGRSVDDTRERVEAAGARDARLRVLEEPARPAGTVGRPWAIAAGCRAARGEWILVVDADVAPRPGMVGGALAAAAAHGLDVVSFSPRIVAPTAGARLLQPAFVTTLVYRFGAAGAPTRDAERHVANGQCLLLRRAILERAGGYEAAARSYCDDVRIVRHLAARGARVGFLDGTRLLDVLMYADAAATWRGWPRSLGMRDATATRWRWIDGALLLLAQALPLPVLVALMAALGRVPASGGRVLSALGTAPGAALGALMVVNAALLLVRVLLLLALAPSFARRGAAYWLSPLADPPAALRVVETMARAQSEWRGMGASPAVERAAV